MIPKVQKEYQQAFEEARLQTNLRRMFGLAIHTVVLQIALLSIRNLFPKISCAKTAIQIPYDYYLLLSFCTLLVSGIYAALFALARKEYIQSRSVKAFLVNSILWVYFIVQATFCTFNILTHQEITGQLILILLVGIVPILNPKRSVAIIGVSALYALLIMFATQWNTDRNGRTLWEKFFCSDECIYFFIITGLAVMASIFIYKLYVSNFILVNQLRDLSETDALTALLNRRKFDAVIRQEWKRALRQGTGLILILFDVDYFKDYNDTYGHIKGDQCLSLIGGALQKTFQRANEYAARYGGEEFAVIIATSGEDNGAFSCERLLSAIAALQIPHARSKAAKTVTISAGVTAMTPKPGDKLAHFIAKTDAALYAAKEAGRNRYAMAKTDESV